MLWQLRRWLFPYRRDYWERLEFEPPISAGERMERAYLFERVASHYPFGSLLEIGCGVGHTFQALAPLFPRARFVGLERDCESVERGREILTRRHIGNTTLIAGDPENLAYLPEGSYDVVVTGGILSQLPEQMQQIVEDLLRIARRRAIFLESHREENGGAPNFREILERCGCVREVKVLALDIPAADRWRENSHLIEVDRRQR